MIKEYSKLFSMTTEEFKAELDKLRQRTRHVERPGWGKAPSVKPKKKRKKNSDNYSSHRGYFK